MVENDGSLTTKEGERKLCLNEDVLSEVLKVLREGIRSVIGKTYSKNIMEICGKMPNLNTFGIPKKFLKGGYQLLFEFVNKVLLSHSKKRTVATITDLFLIENLSKFEPINLPVIILEHIKKILTAKDANMG